MYRRARLGIGYLPQEASIFRGMTSPRTSARCSKSSSRTATGASRTWRCCSRNSRRAPARPARDRAVGGERRRVEIARSHREPPLVHAARRAVRRHRYRSPSATSRCWCAISPAAASACSSPTTMCARPGSDRPRLHHRVRQGADPRAPGGHRGELRRAAPLSRRAVYALTASPRRANEKRDRQETDQDADRRNRCASSRRLGRRSWWRPSELG